MAVGTDMDMTPPRADSGWSREIVTLRDAVIIPPSNARQRKPAGVLRANGRCCLHSLVWRHGKLMTTPPDMPGRVPRHLSGRWLWGGVLFDHFGHFLVESLARLWALQDAGDIAGVVFIPRWPRRGPDLAGFQRAVFECIRPALRVEIATRATRVDTLVVPGQGLGLGVPGDNEHSISRGTTEMHDFARSRFAPTIRAEGPDALFVSRSRLGPARGGLFCEERLDGLMAAEGYTVLHPETVDISTQIARYKAARRIVFTDGSAAHLFALVARADQSVAYIRRRRYWSEGPIQHISGFSGRAPVEIDALVGEWTPSPGSAYKRTSIGQLDFGALQRHLADAGFIATDAAWPVMGHSDVNASMTRHGLAGAFQFSRDEVA